MVGLCLIGKKLEICPIEIEKCIWGTRPKLVYLIKEASGGRRIGIYIKMIFRLAINLQFRWTRPEEEIR